MISKKKKLSYNVIDNTPRNIFSKIVKTKGPELGYILGNSLIWNVIKLYYFYIKIHQMKDKLTGLTIMLSI